MNLPEVLYILLKIFYMTKAEYMKTESGKRTKKNMKKERYEESRENVSYKRTAGPAELARVIWQGYLP
jgi:hypothetical protein